MFVVKRPRIGGRERATRASDSVRPRELLCAPAVPRATRGRAPPATAGLCAAIAAKGDAARAVDLARAQSRITHAAPECLDAAEALTRVLTAGIEGRGHDALNAGAEAKAASPKVSAVAKGIWRGKARPTSVPRAMSSIRWRPRSGRWLTPKHSRRPCSRRSTAATTRTGVGAVAGAQWGYSAMPETWTQRLAWDE